MTSSPAWTFTSPQGSLPLVIKALVRTVRANTLHVITLHISMHLILFFDTLTRILIYFLEHLQFYLFDIYNTNILIYSSYNSSLLVLINSIFYCFTLFVGDISVCVFRVSDGTVLKRLSCGCVCGVAAITFSPDGTMLAVAVQVRTLQSYICITYLLFILQSNNMFFWFFFG